MRHDGGLICCTLLLGSPPDHPLAMNSNNLCVEMLHSRDLSSSMESLAYDSSSTTSPNSIHPNAQTGPPQRTKRMRTSFKHHQLRTMKSYFNVNQNPDAKDLKQLAQKTGLSKRVLQVMGEGLGWRRKSDIENESNCRFGSKMPEPSGEEILCGRNRRSRTVSICCHRRVRQMGSERRRRI